MGHAGVAELLPWQAERHPAKGETVGMAGDPPLQRVALSGDARGDSYRHRIGLGVEADQRVAGPVGPAHIPGEGHGAVVGGEGDGQLMLPVLAQLLQIFARMARGHAGSGGNGHVPWSLQAVDLLRSFVVPRVEARRVGQECVWTVKSGWAGADKKKKKIIKQ